MKKLFLAIIGLCLCTALYADMNTYIIGSGSVGGGCTGDYGNNVSTDSGYDLCNTDTLILYKVTIDCTGTPSSINLRTRLYSSTSTEIVPCVYSDNAGTPNARLWYGSPTYDAAQSEAITTITDSSIDYEFSSGDYWIGFLAESYGRWYKSGTTGGNRWRGTFSGAGNTPPTDISGATDVTTGTSNLEGWLDF